MKVTAGTRKWAERKILKQCTLGGLPLVIVGAGALRHVKDAVEWLDLDKLNARLQSDVPPFDQLLEVVERNLPKFHTDYVSKYGTEPEIQLILSYVDSDHKPRLVEIYADGDYDHKDDLAAIGSGSIFAELLLRRLHRPDMLIQTAKRMVGYIIWEVQSIDNLSGENMQIVCLDNTGHIQEVDDLDIQSYKSLPRLVDPSYEHLRRRIERVNLEDVRQHLVGFDKLLGTMNQQEGHQGSPGKEGGHGKTNNSPRRRHKGTKDAGKPSKGSAEGINQG